MNILFCPAYPNKEFYSLTHIINQLGYNVTLDPQDKFDVAFLWQDSTHLTCPDVLTAINKTTPVLNIGCTDISKITVDAVGQQIFGYSSFIDPTQYMGVCVEKPDNNGVKGGRVISCPITRVNAESVYQYLIDSTIDGYQQEYRVPVILDSLPIVSLVKQHPAVNSLDHRTQLPPIPMAVDQVFSLTEQQQILHFCRQLKLDFGELDIVRCRHTQRLFILDANKTPAGYGMLNYFHWRRADKTRVLSCLASVFDHKLKNLIETGVLP